MISFKHDSSNINNEKAFKVAGSIFASLNLAKSSDYLNNVDIQIVNTNFTSCSAGVSFGAVSLSFQQEALLYNCMFVNNSAKVSGGAVGAYYCETYFNNCTFFSNHVIETIEFVNNSDQELIKRHGATPNGTICYGGGAIALRGKRETRSDLKLNENEIKIRPNARITSCIFDGNVVDEVYGQNADIVIQGDIDVGFYECKTDKDENTFYMLMDNNATVGSYKNATTHNNNETANTISSPKTNNFSPNTYTTQSSTNYGLTNTMSNITFNQPVPPSPVKSPNPTQSLVNFSASRFTIGKIITYSFLTYTPHNSVPPTPSPSHSVSASPSPSASPSHSVSPSPSSSVSPTQSRSPQRSISASKSPTATPDNLVVVSEFKSETVTIIQTISQTFVEVSSETKVIVSESVVSKVESEYGTNYYSSIESLVDGQIQYSQTLSNSITVVHSDTVIYRTSESVSYVNSNGYIFITIQTESRYQSNFYIYSEFSEQIETMSAGLLIGLISAGCAIVFIVAILGVWLYRRQKEGDGDFSGYSSDDTGSFNLNDEEDNNALTTLIGTQSMQDAINGGLTGMLDFDNSDGLEPRVDPDADADWLT